MHESMLGLRSKDQVACIVNFVVSHTRNSEKRGSSSSSKERSPLLTSPPVWCFVRDVGVLVGATGNQPNISEISIS